MGMLTCEVRDCRWYDRGECRREGIRIVEGDNWDPVCDGYQPMEYEDGDETD